VALSIAESSWCASNLPRRIIATLSRQKHCTIFAAELMPLRIDWEGRDPEKVIQGTPDGKRVLGDHPALQGDVLVDGEQGSGE
jgi:hypothetical protein